MATDCAIAAGDLTGARLLAGHAWELYFYREEGAAAAGRQCRAADLSFRTGEWEVARGSASEGAELGAEYATPAAAD